MNLQKGFILFLIALLGVLSFMMLKPFIGYVMFAIILAFLLKPLQRRLSNHLRSGISASLLMVLSIFIAILPLAIASALVVQDASDLSADLNRSELINTTELEIQIEQYTGREINIEQTVDNVVNSFISTTFGRFSKVVNFVAELAIGVTLMLFLIYYLLKDGDKLVTWIKEVTPLPRDIQDALYERINKSTWAVIKGHVAVAVVQGLIAGIGLAVTGVPNYIFWTFMMIILGFIPIIGTIVIWAPAAVYLVLMGQINAGILLMLYGLVVVGLTDNIMRPLVVDKGADLHPAVIIIGVIGGVYLFGAPGLFVGPIVLGIFKSVLLVFKSNYQQL
jgi:predicted PurR-regulated permease PerM